MRILIQINVFQFRGCARSKPQFLIAVESLNLFRLTLIYVWMAYQLYNLENVSWKRHPQSQPRETLSVTHAKESFRLTHILTLVFSSQWTKFHPSCPTVHTQLYLFDDNAAVIQMINSGGSPNLRHATRMHRVDLDWQIERVNLDHSFSGKIRANNKSIGAKIDKGHIHHDATKFIFDFVANQTTLSNDVRSFPDKPFSRLVLQQRHKRCLR